MRYLQALGLALAIALPAALLPQPAAAGALELGVGGARLSVAVTSFKERRFAKVVRQEYDFSCGSAALATLLAYHYEWPVSERQVFKEMYEQGDEARIKRDGFSLLDMKLYLARHGFNADGYRVPLDKLVQAGMPAIALINTKGYSHFVVIKGVKDDTVLVGDPALGVRVMPRPEFESAWNGIVFVVLQGKSAGPRFNVEREWKTQAKAPLSEAVLRHSLAQFSLGLPGTGHF